MKIQSDFQLSRVLVFLFLISQIINRGIFQKSRDGYSQIKNFKVILKKLLLDFSPNILIVYLLEVDGYK